MCVCVCVCVRTYARICVCMHVHVCVRQEGHTCIRRGGGDMYEWKDDRTLVLQERERERERDILYLVDIIQSKLIHTARRGGASAP